MLEQFQQTKPEGPESYAAARQIQLWQGSNSIEGDKDMLVRLYMAVKAMFGGDWQTGSFPK